MCVAVSRSFLSCFCPVCMRAAMSACLMGCGVVGRAATDDLWRRREVLDCCTHAPEM